LNWVATFLTGQQEKVRTVLGAGWVTLSPAGWCIALSLTLFIAKDAAARASRSLFFAAPTGATLAGLG
jgi:hypothetical protein